MNGGDDGGREIFKEEAYELLSELERSLLELEETPDDRELIGRVFRAMHTIKGSGAMFGFEDIAEFTHEIETVYEMVRNGELDVTKELIDVSLLARDHIQAMMDASDGEGTVDEAETRKIIETFRKYIPDTEEESGEVRGGPSEEKGIKKSGPDRDNITYRIRFRPSKDIFETGTNPVTLLKELRQLGDCKIVAHMDDIPELGKHTPGACYTYWDIILTSRAGINAVKDIFIFVEDRSELKIEVIDEGAGPEGGIDHKRLGEILTERGDLSTEDLQAVLATQKRIGEMLVEAGVVESRKIESALVEQRYLREVRRKRRDTEAATSIRVASGKLDGLVDLVGELVTVQARLSQTVSGKDDPELLGIAEEVERLTGELRDGTLSIRMLPIGTTFSKFKRLVRDLSCELGKDIELVTEGGETELDKTVIERLNDPLVHLIRNSIDHGIEPPGVREAGGKPRKGTIKLTAYNSGANVMIEVQDDGVGLDLEGIRAKAVEKGMIEPGSAPGDKETYALILAPGFSTAGEITGISGRGVGMDVVRRSAESLHGSIDIRSRKNIGTTITLKLPLTLAIIDGLLVKIGEDSFVVPLSEVEECVELTREARAKAHGRRLANVRSEMVPYIRLREYFDIAGESPEIEQIVITGDNGRRVGFVVDNVIGGHQTVIKTLGKCYRDIEGISGATILGDGTVALILDVHKLIRKGEAMEAESGECITSNIRGEGEFLSPRG